MPIYSEYRKQKKSIQQIEQGQMKWFVGMFYLLAPTIEEHVTAVEKDGRLDTGNSYRGILYELGKLLERVKVVI